MLVISQKVGDKIVMSNGITINILEIKAGKVRIGVEAPKDVRIRRSEKKKTSFYKPFEN